MNDFIGKPVSWTHVSQGRRSLSMSRKEGVVQEIDGGIATVKLASGKTVQVHTARLRLLGQPSQITEFIEAVKSARDQA